MTQLSAVVVVVVVVVASAFVTAVVNGQVDDQYCTRHPGDVSFAYSTTNDENSWYQNYQNAYVGTKKGSTYTIHRRRTVITRHPPSMFNSNAFSPFVQQVQQQQIVQQMPVNEPVSSIMDGMMEPSGENSTEAEDQEPVPLPIWKLTMPIPARRVVVARVEKGEILESFELNGTHFDNETETETSTPNAPVMTVSSFGSTRTVDITDQSIVPNAWYAICLWVNVVEAKTASVCRHCTLLKARRDNSRQQFLDYDWTDNMSNTTAELRYFTTDMPFETMTATTRITTSPRTPRCHAEPFSEVFTSMDVLYPQHFLYIDVTGLLGRQSYAVKTTVESSWSKPPPNDLLPEPFVARDYLQKTSETDKLAQCEDYNYKGE